LVAPPAVAKDLNGRFGVGFSQQFGGDGGMSAVSLRYGLPTGKPTTNIGLEADVGANVTSVTDFFVGGRLLWGVVAEDNMNLYLGAGVGYLQRHVGVDQDDGTVDQEAAGGLRIQPSLGAEFFLFGLENLGFTTELGVNVDLGDT